MGREAEVTKKRVCKNCGEDFYGDAQDLKEHVQLCKRASSIGLVLPGGIVRPQNDDPVRVIDLR